ncbi:hypothetical protein [Sulfitobacter sp. CW3]|uniref:hypothetical protein n=1 Tax=Sulfitobacter sp. CW3 TaxID=2861965 RepID=UPI001C5DE6DB|nr:hypothetical protein [Sulfitobacter sp. CW3]MBW4964146.1 hypothetical protein [Sulfitobacter sp. CW3]
MLIKAIRPNGKPNTRVITLIVMFLVAVWVYALFYPALNWPDEAYKVARVGQDPNPYLQLLSWLTVDYCYLTYEHDLQAGYVSNTLHMHLTNGHSCYYMLKIANTGLACIIFLTCMFALKTREKRELFGMSLIWPAAVFYMTGINQQVVFSIVSPAIVIGVIYSSKVWPYILASLLLTAIDRSFVALFTFLAMLSVFRSSPRLAFLMFVLLIIAGKVILSYIGGLSLFLGGQQSLNELKSSLSYLSDSPLLSLMFFFISFVYLGGTNSILGIGLDYAIVFFALVALLWNNRSNSQMVPYLVSFLATFFIVINFVPTLQSFRYYVFIMPAIIHFLAYKRINKDLYVGYCSVMLLVYIFQVSLINA